MNEPNFSGGQTSLDSLGIKVGSSASPPMGQQMGHTQMGQQMGQQMDHQQMGHMGQMGNPQMGHQMGYQMDHPQMGHPQIGHPQMGYQKMGRQESFSKTTKFEELTNCKWQVFVAIIILCILFNNSILYNLEMSIIPVNMRFGTPPFLAVIFNSIVIACIFLIINKYVF